MFRFHYHSSTTWMVMMLCVIVPTSVFAQKNSDSTSSKRVIENVLITVNNPVDAKDEWYIYMNDGKTISCNRSDIRVAGEQLIITGSLRNITIPRAEVSSIIMKPRSSKFRDGFIFGALLGSTILFSPSETPGYFISSGSNSSENLNTWTVLLTSLLATGVGGLNMLDAPRQQIVTFDGSESENAWRRLIETPSSNFHVRWVVGIVSDQASDRWGQHLKESGGTANSYTYSNRNDITSFNILRFLSATYSVSPKVEIGGGILTGGTKQTEYEFTYMNPGTPPYPSNISFRGQISTTGYFLLSNYYVLTPAPNTIIPRIGVGVGMVNTSDMSYVNYYSSSGKEGSLSTSKLSMYFSASLDLFLDNSMSIGLNGDYAMVGSVTLPEYQLKDYNGNVRYILPPMDLNLNTFSVGLGFTWHY